MIYKTFSLNHNPVHFSFMAYHRVCYKCNKMGATSEAGTVYLSWNTRVHLQLLMGFVLFSFMCKDDVSKWCDMSTRGQLCY
jgi:hypothetical protein